MKNIDIKKGLHRIKSRLTYWWDIDISKKHRLKAIPGDAVQNRHIKSLSRSNGFSGPNMIRNKKTGTVVVFHGGIEDFRSSQYSNEEYELVESKIR